MSLGPLLAAVALACVHLLGGRLAFFTRLPRSNWLSFAGGVSVAYVFVRVLPELAAAQETIRRALPALLGFLEHHAYLVALLGLVVFYGLERTAVTSRREQQQAEGEDTPSTAVFWLHIGSFAVYNALVGYLLVRREDPDPYGLALYAVALGLHLMVTDQGLRAHHKTTYDRRGRWLLAGAVLVGWALGMATHISEAAIAMLLGFLAGGVVLNVLKEELPAERESRFLPFALGAAAYAALLLRV